MFLHPCGVRFVRAPDISLGLSALTLVREHPSNVPVAPWFLRATEQTDGSWAFQWLGVEHDSLPTEAAALSFLATVATALGGRHLFEFHLHRRDGRIERRPASQRLS